MTVTLTTPIIVTFVVYLVAMLGIGVFTYRFNNNLSDFVLGGRNLGPGVAALSAGASDMSGWLLLGLPGAMYAMGMNQIWLTVGLCIGAYLNWQFVAKRLRVYTEVAQDAITVPDYFENRFRDHSKLLRVFSAAVTLLFFTFYTSSGMVGGAVLFQSTFGMDYILALWLGAVVIVSYTFLGGFLAVCWTDFVQGIMMFLALVILPISVASALGGWDVAVERVGTINMSFNDAFTGMTGLAILSLMAWGLGYFGQPHIVVRFMAARRPRDIPTAQLICMTWMVLSLFGAIFTGYIGIAYFADKPLANAETVFLNLSQILFNPWVAGVLLSAVLAAIMSTISSQLLVCSSALTEDFYKIFLRKQASQHELVWVGRISVLAIALIAILIAYNPQSTVLGLVAYAWGGLGAAFGPVMILSLFWRRMTRNGALTGMLLGAATVVIWKQLSVWGGIFEVYELLPGFILATLGIVVVSLMDKEPGRAIQAEFDSVASAVRSRMP